VAASRCSRPSGSSRRGRCLSRLRACGGPHCPPDLPRTSYRDSPTRRADSPSPGHLFFARRVTPRRRGGMTLSIFSIVPSWGVAARTRGVTNARNGLDSICRRAPASHEGGSTDHGAKGCCLWFGRAVGGGTGRAELQQQAAMLRPTCRRTSQRRRPARLARPCTRAWLLRVAGKPPTPTRRTPRGLVMCPA
jgi:hypothetical protein